MLHVQLDDEDLDKKTALIFYPSVLENAEYVTPSIKIESGTKSALDPHETKTILPYLAADLPDPGPLSIPQITTIQPERTFLDKILILHGMAAFFLAAKRGSFLLQPPREMLGPLRQDYDAMATMVFGRIPTFDAILQSLADAERLLNEA
jgi:hypothetical protein